METVIKPYLITGNNDANGNDLGDLYSFEFSTGKGENEPVRMSISSHGGDFSIGEAQLYKFDDTQIVAPTSNDIVGKYTTGELPVMVHGHKDSLSANENIWKVHFFENGGSDLQGQYRNVAALDGIKETLFNSYKTHPNHAIKQGQNEGLPAGFYWRSINYVPEAQLINHLGLSSMGQTSERGILAGSTSIYTDRAKNIKMRLGLTSGFLKVNGQVVYSSLADEQKGCYVGKTGEIYPQANEKNGAIVKSCIVSIDLQEGDNLFEFVSILGHHEIGYKGFYKEYILHSTEHKTGNTERELLTFNHQD